MINSVKGSCLEAGKVCIDNKLLVNNACIDRFVIGNIVSYFKGSPLAVLKSTEYDEKIYVKVEDIPNFCNEIGDELCFDVVKVYSHGKHKYIYKAINARPTVYDETLFEYCM